MRYFIFALLFCAGCSTVKVTSSFEVDTQEGKSGRIIPHAALKVSFSKNDEGKNKNGRD